MRKKGAPQAVCKCGHVYGSHVVNFTDAEPDDCQSGWPWYRHGKCGCTKFRPRYRKVSR